VTDNGCIRCGLGKGKGTGLILSGTVGWTDFDRDEFEALAELPAEGAFFFTANLEGSLAGKPLFIISIFHVKAKKNQITQIHNYVRAGGCSGCF
jgi:hypothetical protein